MKFLQKVWKKLIKREKAIVLDVSALKSKRAMEIIEEATKVILLTGTIKELDKHKNARESFGSNIRTVSRKSREDEKSKKYVCVAGYEKNSYQDFNIIDYCKKNRNTIILTMDNDLCNMAKAYRIPYIFPEDEELPKVKDVAKEDAFKEDVVKENVAEEDASKGDVEKEDGEAKTSKENMEKKSKPEESEDISQREVVLYKNYIRVNREKGHIKYINVERCGELIKIKKYKEGDTLYISDYSKSNKYWKIREYEIEKVDSEYKAKEKSETVIWYVNEIFKSNFSENLKEEIWKLFIRHSGY